MRAVDEEHSVVAPVGDQQVARNRGRRMQNEPGRGAPCTDPLCRRLDVGCRQTGQREREDQRDRGGDEESGDLASPTSDEKGAPAARGSAHAHPSSMAGSADGIALNDAKVPSSHERQMKRGWADRRDREDRSSQMGAVASSTRAGVIVVISAAAAAGSGGAASAVPAPARAWPGATIGYHDQTGGHGYHAAVLAAVAAWNDVRLGVRFVPVSPRVASVQIVFVDGRCLSGVAGRAPVGFQRLGARVVVRSCPAIVRPLLVAHELGRVLGLRNDANGCSLMNANGSSDGLTYAVPARCSRDRPPAWLPLLVDPISASHARSLYAPPPAALDVRFTTGPQPRLDWLEPKGSSRRTIVLRATGRCPVAGDVAGGTDATVVYSKASFAGLHYAIDTSLGATPGSYCYRLFNLSASGRPTASRAFKVSIARGPVAAAAVLTSPVVVGMPVTFADRSTDDAASIVHWTWNFGDPAGGAADVVDTADPTVGRAPSYTYAKPGTYTVTLTITDALGRSATTTLGVVVQS